VTSLLKHAARTTGLTSADKRAAERLLGHRHKLTRALATEHSLAVQSLVAVIAVVVSGIGVVLGVGGASLVAVAAAIVGAAFVLGWSITLHMVRERAQDLIAISDEGVLVPVVARERRRLGSRKERERLAKSLEGYVRDATRWTRIDPRSRPPIGVRCLLLARREARDVTMLVRGEAPSLRGVVALLRFLTDGQHSSLFAGDVPRLRWELARIAALLESDESRRAQRAA